MSHKSARLAEKLGYQKVLVYSAGYPAWKKFIGKGQKKTVIKAGGEEGSINIETFKTILREDPDSIELIDVRDPDEFDAGHFKTAVNYPSDTLDMVMKNLSAEKPIVFVCSTGARSGEAFYMAQDVRPDLKKVFYVEATITYHADGTYDFKVEE